MRLNDLDGKEIVNARDGERLGVFDSRDVVVNSEKGCVDGILLSIKGSLPFGSRDKRQTVIPWTSIRTIGRDIIIVDVGPAVIDNTNSM